MTGKLIDQKSRDQKSWESKEDIYSNKSTRKNFLEEMVEKNEKNVPLSVPMKTI